MKITILGTGNVGSALGKGWIVAGHSVLFGARNSASPKAQKIQDLLPDVRIQSVEDAVKGAEVLVITTPPEVVLDLIPSLGDLSGKIIIDATNSVRTRPGPYPTAFHAIKALAPSAEVVKCFNTTGFENLADPVYQGTGIDMFAAGNSLVAKQAASKLARDLGFETCYDFGGDDKVELLEKLALSWINLALMQGLGRNIAFKLVKR
ncbi:MAG TPA: NAD(P)-binding domain-containing protein [Saprospiraceae bacterium]|nr:NAD(P)-binding domain-containing protein [Saprospiraceae bacterium]HNT20917.1 NAD(P)-binding domain-containing protein [Saprospiraceae bacterium]